MPSTPVPVAIALGSNLGDRRGHLEWAVLHLSNTVADLRVSAVVETEPLDVPDVQPPYLNAVVTGTTVTPARELLEQFQLLERKRGRTRTTFRAARTLDIDLILYGDETIAEPGIEVPHPRFRERRFVLEPLAAVAPDMRDPVTGKTIRELLQVLGPD